MRSTAILLLSTIASGGPTRGTDPEGGDECRLTLLVGGQAVPVATSAAHARWIAATVNSGAVVQVEGIWRAEGLGEVLQAWQVDPLPPTTEGA